MKRIFDLIFGLIVSLLVFLPSLVISFIIKVSTKGPVLHWSERVGFNNKIFMMPKFRTMSLNTPQLATDLLEDPDSYYTPVGKFIRKYSLDEFPQIYSILRGDMSFVGPRPALFNQYDLIEQRTKKEINKLIPGLTGWAQVNGRDELSIQNKVKFDAEYLKRKSLKFDFYIIYITLKKVVRRDGVSH